MNPTAPPRPTRTVAPAPTGAPPVLQATQPLAAPADGWGQFYPRPATSDAATDALRPAPAAPMPVVAEVLVAQLPENLDSVFLTMSQQEQRDYSECLGQLAELHLGEHELKKQLRATVATDPTRRLDFVMRVCAGYADLSQDLQQRLQDVHGAAGETLTRTLEQFADIPWQSWRAAVDCMVRLAANQPASWLTDEFAYTLRLLDPARWPVLEVTLNAVCEATPKDACDATATLEPRAWWAKQLAAVPFDLWSELASIAYDCLPPQVKDAAGTPMLLLCAQAATQIAAEAVARERPADEAYQFLQLVKAVFVPNMTDASDAKILTALRDACVLHGVGAVYGTVVNTALNDTMNAPQRRVVLRAFANVSASHAPLFYQLIEHFAAVDDDARKANLVVAVAEPHPRLATLNKILGRLAAAHVQSAHRGAVAGKLLAIVDQMDIMDGWCARLVAKRVTGEALKSAMFALTAVAEANREYYFTQAASSSNATPRFPR